MKIVITMKDTDALINSIGDAVRDGIVANLPEDEAMVIIEKREEKALELCGKWFEYSEYLTVEVDTEKETIKVLTVKESNEV